MLGDGRLHSMTTSLGRGVGDLTQIEAPAGLQELTVRSAPDLRTLDGIERFNALEVLTLCAVPALESAAALGQLQSLAVLGIGFARNLRDLSSISGASAVRRLALLSCGVSSLGGRGMPGLRELFIQGNPGIEDLRSLGGAPGLRKVTILDMPSMRSVNGMEHSRLLLEIAIRNAPELVDIEALQVGRLSRFHIERTPLRSVGVLKRASRLTSVDLFDCGLLRSIEPIRGKRRLGALGLRGLPVEDLEPMLDLPGLKWLNSNSVRTTTRAELLRVARQGCAAGRSSSNSWDGNVPSTDDLDDLLFRVGEVGAVSLSDSDAMFGQVLHVRPDGVLVYGSDCWGNGYIWGPLLLSEFGGLVTRESDFEGRLEACKVRD
jgi:hypothetical protein